MANKHHIFINRMNASECQMCHFMEDELVELPECSELTMINKEWIDDATYEEMAERNRVASPGDTMLIGDMGQYFLKQLSEKRQRINNEN